MKGKEGKSNLPFSSADDLPEKITKELRKNLEGQYRKVRKEVKESKK